MPPVLPEVYDFPLPIADNLRRFCNHNNEDGGADDAIVQKQAVHGDQEPKGSAKAFSGNPGIWPAGERTMKRKKSV